MNKMRKIKLIGKNSVTERAGRFHLINFDSLLKLRFVFDLRNIHILLSFVAYKFDSQ